MLCDVVSNVNEVLNIMQVIVVYCCGAHYKESVTLQGCDHRRLKHGGLVMMASCIVDLNFLFFFLHVQHNYRTPQNT